MGSSNGEGLFACIFSIMDMKIPGFSWHPHLQHLYFDKLSVIIMAGQHWASFTALLTRFYLTEEARIGYGRVGM